jgi:D-alanine-D-alanine ligase-like ATP-grasp enzyme
MDDSADLIVPAKLDKKIQADLQLLAARVFDYFN